MTRGTQGALKLSHRGDRQLAVSGNNIRVIHVLAGQSSLGLPPGGAPSRIRTCAQGSGESENLSFRAKQMLVSKQFWSAVGRGGCRPAAGRWYYSSTLLSEPDGRLDCAVVSRGG